MSGVKHQPGTPLPWAAKDKSPSYEPLVSLAGHPRALLTYTREDDGIHFDPRDLAYIAHAGNAYPKLVKALRAARGCTVEAANSADRLLRELGEAP